MGGRYDEAEKVSNIAADLASLSSEPNQVDSGEGKTMGLEWGGV